MSHSFAKEHFWFLGYFSSCLEAAKLQQLPLVLVVSEVEMAGHK